MDSSRLTSKLNALKDRKSLFTIALFALILLYTLTIPLIAYLTAQYTSLTAIDAATILTPIGTVLVSLLLAVLYYQMLIVQDTQVAIMDRQANWAEAANSPAVIINQWWTRGRDTVVFRLSNRGNSHVEKIRLLVDLRVNDTTTGKTVRQFESRTTLSRDAAEGFESRFVPANLVESTRYTAGIGFKRETPNGSTRLSRTSSVLHDLTKNREKVLPCEFIMKLEIIAPGENIEEREFYRFSIGVFEEREFTDLLKDGKWEGRTLHVQPN